MATEFDTDKLQLDTVPQQNPLVVIKIGDTKSQAMSIADAKLQPYSEKATHETIFEINEETILILTTILGGDAEDKSDLELARKLFLLGLCSTSLISFCKDQNTSILTTLQSDLPTLQNGSLTTVLNIKRTVGISLQIEHLHKQNDHETGKGTSTLIIDKYPFDETGETKGKAQINKNLPLVQDRISAQPFVITQDQIDTYAAITGDHSPAHTEPGYLQRSRFNISETIAYGTLVASACTMQLSKALGNYGYTGELVAVSFRFINPVITNKTEIIAFLGKKPKKLENGKLKFSLTVVDQEQSILVKGWVEIQKLS